MSKSQKFWMSSLGLSKLEYPVVSFVFTICLSSIEFTGWLPLYILRRRMNSLNIICCYEFGTRTILVKIPSEWPKQSLKISHKISIILLSINVCLRWPTCCHLHIRFYSSNVALWIPILMVKKPVIDLLRTLEIKFVLDSSIQRSVEISLIL